MTHDEAYYTDEVWRQAHYGTNAERLAVLCRLAELVLGPPSVRGELPKKQETTCFVCNAVARLRWHHVILVKHGGSDSPRNLVAICRTCHASIHPWMQPMPSTAGFIKIGSFAESALTAPADEDN